MQDLPNFGKRLTHASLFSGIGGAELAAAWMGWENLFHCDINPFGLQVLRYWFPKSKEYNDIKNTDFTPWRGRVDVLTGGFPCQCFSLSGRRRGRDDDRYLWPEMCRAIREIQPRYVVGENVIGILSMVECEEERVVAGAPSLFDPSRDIRTVTYRFTTERIMSDLEACGYAVQPFVIPSVAIGAPHVRERVWFIARRTPDTHGTGRGEGESQGVQGDKDGSYSVKDQLHGVPRGGGAPRTSPEPVMSEPRPIPPFGGFQDFPTKSPLCGGDDGLPDGVADSPVFNGEFSQWRTEAVKALGNAWCPQVAMEIFRAIEADATLSF